MERARLVILSLILVFLTAFAPYQPLQDLSFTRRANGEIEVGDYKLNYVFYFGASGYTETWLLAHLIDASEKLVKYAESKKFSTKECRPVENLSIFIITDRLLNDRTRFNQYREANEQQEVWALFDQMRYAPQDVAIILTDQQKHNVDLFVHELAHYWAYRFCWDFHYPEVDGEKIALEFESFFKEGK